MTDLRASFEGVFGRPRHQSPTVDTYPAHSESDIVSESPAASPVHRRRSLRAKSTSDEASEQSPSAWLDVDKDVHKPKGGRISLRKSSDIASQTVTSSELSYTDTGKEATGFLPKLSRILEGKESTPARRKRGSTVSSRESHNPARRRARPVDDAALRNRSVRQKHGSLQRRVGNLADLPNPSLISVLSGLTQHSGTSNGSNSTITQQSYDRKAIAKRKPTKSRKRPQTNAGPSTDAATTMDSQQPSVFQYMDHSKTSNPFVNGYRHANSPSSASSSSSSSSSGNSQHEGLSSTAEEHVAESPATSPASMRRPNIEHSHDEEGTDSDRPESRARSAYQPSVSDVANDSDGQDDEAEEKDQSDEEESEENALAPGEAESQPSHLDHMALERVPPPRLPSTSSSRHSDRHTRRLRRQEQALNEHILQAPQPQRDFHFAGGPSPHAHPAIPLYDPYQQPGASPANFYATAQHGPPPAPQPPPPQPIDYYSPMHAPPASYSPRQGTDLSLAARPPMAPSVAAQPSQVQYSPVHPPRYQAYPPGPDLSKTTVVGYEMLAEKLSGGVDENRSGLKEETVVPMYRKFENLNHRVLLHLQDELSEMEEELRYLDECIAQCSPWNEAGHHHPASRRGEARYGGEMQYRRTQLLGHIYLKLGQYNSAVTSFNNMVAKLDPADGEEVQTYRTWIEKRTPIDQMETKFLEHKTDLLTFRCRRSASTVGSVVQPDSGIVWLGSIGVLPLLVFVIVPGLLGRLLVLSLTSAAIMRLVTTTKEMMEMRSTREWAGLVSVYFVLMAVLAASAN